MILLVSLNSRYSHTNLALRYIKANLKELEKHSKILEFSINQDLNLVVEEILKYNPKIVGFSIYIWSAKESKYVIDLIKSINKKIIIIAGGPEVAHTPHRVDFKNVDYFICGEGEVAFYELCKDLLDKKTIKDRFIYPQILDLKKIKFPYDNFSQDDIKNKIIYVESSRGCPYKCEFCLSSIDKKVRYFDIDLFINELEKLWNRGVRNFKFIDRTFNLNIKVAIELIDYFLQKQQIDDFRLHFEVIPDNFPNKLKQKLTLFKKNILQLEIGIQSLNPKVLKNINRSMDLEKVKQNLYFLDNYTNAHLHVDLIIGLPGESVESFKNNLNQLKKLTKAEIQVGILKKLSGTTINRHDKEYDMVYSPYPPYEIMQNSLIDYFTMQKLKRFARFWDIFYNSGQFFYTIEYLFNDGRVFENFFEFSKFIFNKTNQTHKISLNRQSELLFEFLTEVKNFNKTEIADSFIKDLMRIEGRTILPFMREFASKIPDLRGKKIKKENKRQLLRN